MPISRYQVLLQQQADLTHEAAAAYAAAEAEGRGLSAAEQARDDAIEQELGSTSAELGRLARQRERERTVSAVAAATALAAPPLQVGPRVAQVHDRLLDRPWGWQWQQAGAPTGIVKAAANGEWLQAVRRAGTGQGIDPRLQYEAAARDAGEATPADGGFLVGTEMANDIRVDLFTGQLLRRVDSRTLTGPVNSITYNMIDESSRATGSRFGGVQGYWVDEGTAPSQTKPTFWKLKLEVHKVAALYVATDELLEDTVELGRVVPAALAEELRFLAEDRILNGGGAGAPTGIVGHAATVSVAKETGQAAATVVWENIKKMWSRMAASSRGNAVWHINQDVEPELFGLSQVVGTGGFPVFLPPGGAAADPYSRLMGRPVVPIEYCPTLGTVGDLVLADWSQYRFIDKGGVQQAVSMHLYFDTSEQAFRATYRADGKPKWRTTKTPFKGTNTQAPFVTLATRA